MRRPRCRRIDRFANVDYVHALERYADHLEGRLKTARRDREDCLRKYGATIRRYRKAER